MLVKELKMPESNKIINRKAFATVPPTVEYSLTEKGKELELVLNQIKIGVGKIFSFSAINQRTSKSGVLLRLIVAKL